MVAVEHQHHRLLPLCEVSRQPAQHGVGITDAFGVDLQHGAGLRGDVRRGGDRGEHIALAVLVGGVAHVVLDGGGVVEQGAALADRRFKFFLDQTSHVVIRDPAALVFQILHVLGKYLVLRPQPAVDVLPVVEPGVAGMVEGGAVAVRPEHPEQAVQIPVHHPHGGGGGDGEGVGLHPRQRIELRVGGASGEAGDHDVTGKGVGVLLQSVEIGQGIGFLRPVEHRLVGEVGKRLVHHKDHADVLAESRLPAGLPTGGLGLGKALRLVHRIGGELVAETVGETKLVEYRRDIVGVADPEGIVEIVAGVH